MPATTTDPRRQLLTRADLHRLQIAAERVIEWLAAGSIEQIGQLLPPGTDPAAATTYGDPVFAVHSGELRRELAILLAELGRREVALQPTHARSQLVRVLLAERGVNLPAPDADGAVPDAELAVLLAPEADLARDEEADAMQKPETEVATPEEQRTDDAAPEQRPAAADAANGAGDYDLFADHATEESLDATIDSITDAIEDLLVTSDAARGTVLPESVGPLAPESSARNKWPLAPTPGAGRQPAAGDADSRRQSEADPPLPAPTPTPADAGDAVDSDQQVAGGDAAAEESAMLDDASETEAIDPNDGADSTVEVLHAQSIDFDAPDELHASWPDEPEPLDEATAAEAVAAAAVGDDAAPDLAASPTEADASHDDEDRPPPPAESEPEPAPADPESAIAIDDEPEQPPLEPATSADAFGDPAALTAAADELAEEVVRDAEAEDLTDDDVVTEQDLSLDGTTDGEASYLDAGAIADAASDASRMPSAIAPETDDEPVADDAIELEADPDSATADAGSTVVDQLVRQVLDDDDDDDDEDEAVAAEPAGAASATIAPEIDAALDEAVPAADDMAADDTTANDTVTPAEVEAALDSLFGDEPADAATPAEPTEDQAQPEVVDDSIATPDQTNRDPAAHPAATTMAAAPAPAAADLGPITDALQQIHLALLTLAERPAPQPDMVPVVAAVEHGFLGVSESLQGGAGLGAVVERLERLSGAIASGSAAIAEGIATRARAAAAVPGQAATATRRGPFGAMAAVAMMVVGWVGALWLHTGDPRTAMIALFAANLLGCSILLWKRP